MLNHDSREGQSANNITIGDDLIQLFLEDQRRLREEQCRLKATG